MPWWFPVAGVAPPGRRARGSFDCNRQLANDRGRSVGSLLVAGIAHGVTIDIGLIGVRDRCAVVHEITDPIEIEIRFWDHHLLGHAQGRRDVAGGVPGGNLVTGDARQPAGVRGVGFFVPLRPSSRLLVRRRGLSAAQAAVAVDVVVHDGRVVVGWLPGKPYVLVDRLFVVHTEANWRGGDVGISEVQR